MATWLATVHASRGVRLAATLVAVLGWFAVIGLGDEVVIGGVELEWPLVVWATLLVLVARALLGLARATEDQSAELG